jgi:hypothetical protein
MFEYVVKDNWFPLHVDVKKRFLLNVLHVCCRNSTFTTHFYRDKIGVRSISYKRKFFSLLLLIGKLNDRFLFLNIFLLFSAMDFYHGFCSFMNVFFVWNISSSLHIHTYSVLSVNKSSILMNTIFSIDKAFYSLSQNFIVSQCVDKSCSFFFRSSIKV